MILKVITRGGKVLIHSVQGVSRCATICLAFLTKYKFKTLRDAYMYLASIRPKVEPNIGFWRQLISFEQDVKQSTSSVKIVRDENNPSILVPDVYRKYYLCCKTKQQLAKNTVNVAEGSKQNEISRKEKEIISGQTSGTVPESTKFTAMLKSMNHTIAEASGSKSFSSQTSNQESQISRRKSSLMKKFQPVLEPLVEHV
ncbi:unnamed protein product [Onchocerca flexuosa]|uniref:Tyrosine-protein phosphatase domain-containing protein n=1 Tax=Onchocerca flexuosa TaxID=387005 RepID=A0A183I6T6_9BILA|nr:unnamed protein product [Onchocerca flexuosa]